MNKIVSLFILICLLSGCDYPSTNNYHQQPKINVYERIYGEWYDDDRFDNPLGHTLNYANANYCYRNGISYDSCEVLDNDTCPPGYRTEIQYKPSYMVHCIDRNNRRYFPSWSNGGQWFGNLYYDSTSGTYQHPRYKKYRYYNTQYSVGKPWKTRTRLLFSKPSNKTIRSINASVESNLRQIQQREYRKRLDAG